MEVAIEILKKSIINGDWLCLKNIHLVVSWLPVLEKVSHILLLFRLDQSVYYNIVI